MRALALLFASALLGAAAPVAQAQTFEWTGADGTRVEFASRDEALAFLRTATILSTETIPIGVTAPRKVLLERDGLRLNAVFRDVDRVDERVRLNDGTFHARLHDSALFEVAAYRVAMLLGIENVPPAVVRSINGRRGSLQLWVENAITGTERQERGVEPADYRAWTAQIRALTLFDLIIGNVDRNSGNYLLDDRGRVWFIDHTRSFQTFVRDWSPEPIDFVTRDLWRRLQRLDRATLVAELSDLLAPNEIDHLLDRVEAIIDHVERLIAKRGEGSVVIDLSRSGR